MFSADSSRKCASLCETCPVKDGNIWNSDVNVKKHDQETLVTSVQVA
jgi:hypothetical protein